MDDTVASLYAAFGNRKAVACRELTKTFEQRVEFELQSGYSGEKRGEFVLVVQGAEPTSSDFADVSVEEHLASFLAQGMDKKQAVKAVAKARGVNKNEIYMQAVNIFGEND